MYAMKHTAARPMVPMLAPTAIAATFLRLLVTLPDELDDWSEVGEVNTDGVDEDEVGIGEGVGAALAVEEIVTLVIVVGGGVIERTVVVVSPLLCRQKP
jgi:hypothetical protein